MKQYQRKTKDIYILQGLYCGMWCDLLEEETRQEARKQFTCYNQNESNIYHRIIKKRVKV